MGDLPTPTLMANYNKTILMGNLTRDPEPRTTQSGLSVCKLGLAVNRKRDGETTTCFVDMTAFGKSAEILTQYCKKGDPLFVDGRLDFSTWEGKDGTQGCDAVLSGATGRLYRTGSIVDLAVGLPSRNHNHPETLTRQRESTRC